MRAAALALLAGSLAVVALPETLAPPVPAALASALRWLAALGTCALVVRPPRDVLPRAAALVLAGALLSSATLAGERARRAVFEPATPGDRIDVVLTGRVSGVPAERAGVTSFVLAVESMEGAGKARPPPRGTRVRLSSRVPGFAPRAGERWRLAARLGPLDGLANAGGFDRERWLLRMRLHARGGVRSEPAPERLDASPRAPADALSSARQATRGALAALPSANARLPIVEALALGLGDGVTLETRELLRATGTAHLLAISGLHVGLIAALAAGIGKGGARAALKIAAARERRLGLDPATVAIVCGVAAALAYTLAAGAALPTRRALAMLACVGAVALAHRRLGRGDALATAWVAVLLVDPLAPLAPGAWLSFGAVATVLWLHAARRLPKVRVLAALRTHALLGVALLPAGAWFFGEAAPAAPLANLVAVPLATLVVVPASLAAAALAGPLPVLADPVLIVAQHATGLLLSILARVDALTGGDGTPATLTLPGLAGLLCALLGCVVATLPGRRTLLVLVPALLLPAALHLARGRPVAPLEVHVLDVGQGLAVLLLTPGATVLYDTGGRFGEDTMLERVVLPHLHALGRRRIDRLVVSHADSDHSAGLAAAHARFPDMAIWAGDVAAAQRALPAGVPVSACEVGRGFELDGVRFDVLHPGARDAGSENDRSCALLVHLGRSRVLLPGDIETGAEGRLVARAGAPLPVDLLISPHHGSRTSSTFEFVRAFPATRVVHAAGLGNRFGFPHASVRMRYKSAGAVQYVTGISGALAFRFGVDGPIAPPEAHRRRGRLESQRGIQGVALRP